MKIAYVNGYVLSGKEDMKPESGLAVLTDGDKIVDILPEKEANLEGYEVIDLDEQYLMPGLINMHVHLPASGKAPKANAKPIDYKKLFRIFSIPGVTGVFKLLQRGLVKKELYSGCTTIRTVGGIMDFDTKERDRIESGKEVGPRILAGNTGITVPGGHFAGSLATEAETEEEVRALVRTKADEGVNLIKLMITGGVMDATADGEPGILRMPLPLVSAACDEAHKLGLPVAAHVESPEGLRVALQGGVDTIEHGAKPDDEIIELFKKTGSAHICTLSPAIPYALMDDSVSHCGDMGKRNGKIVLDGVIACAKACLENGIPVGLGTDTGCPFIRDYDMWRELVYFHNFIGVSNAFALYTATKRNAEIAGIDDKVGTIEVGKCADMIVTEDNPLEDLKTLRYPTAVIARGNMIAYPTYKVDKKIEAALDPFLEYVPEN